MMGRLVRSARRAAGPIGLTVAVALSTASAASAATYSVGTTNDSTGTCAAPASGTCSLRQLITYEDGLGSTPSPADIIDVPAGAYSLTNGALTITQSVTIAGGGARTTTVAETTADRVFEVEPLASGAAATVTISGLTISGGTAPGTGSYAFFGGDVQNVRDSLTLSEDWLTEGTAYSGGGASNRGGSLTVTHSLVSKNQATLGGADSGGIQNYGDNTVGAGSLQVDNSTVAGNTSHLGGGIFSWCGSSPCSVNNSTTITRSTIAYNDGGTRSNVGGGLLTSAGAIDVESSIVAFNTVDTPNAGTASNCGTSGGGTISSFFNQNMETGTDCGFTATGDLQNTDPKFTSTTPQNNGGNTNTLGLSPASPAVDAFGERGAYCDGTDQRDTSRPAGRGCDIGAFELVPTYNAIEGGTPLSGQFVPTDCPVISMQITWGDGTQSAGTSAGQGSHTYAEEGTYNGSITWNSDDCGSGNYTSTFVADVADAPLSATGSQLNSTAGSSFTSQIATFTDSDPNGTASDYSATINWGDGSVSAGTVMAFAGGFQVAGTHTYASGGVYSTSISISDAGGANTVAHGTVAVASSPSPVITGAPTVGSTTAGFSGSVDPDGLPASAFFQYGLDPKYTGGGPLVYIQSTPTQSVGSDFSSHIVSASVGSLAPNAVYHVRLAATNSAGTTFGPDVTFTTGMLPAPGSPTLGKTFNVSLVSGIVLVKVHGLFIPLTELTQIPENTVINALHGTLTLTTAALGPPGARDAAKGKKKHRTPTQKGTFGGAIFKISQATRGAGKGLVTLAIVEGAFKGAPSYSLCTKHRAADPTATAASSKTLQLLHASAHGKFRTKGRYSAATVLGTKWTLADRCDGTLTHDITDSVAVNDFVHHKTIVLHAGQSYLAKKP